MLIKTLRQRTLLAVTILLAANLLTFIPSYMIEVNKSESHIYRPGPLSGPGPQTAYALNYYAYAEWMSAK